MLVTVHNSFKLHRVMPVPFQPPKIADATQAWQYIIANWMTPYWQPLPEWVRAVIEFHPQLGMCSGSLVTRVGDRGMDQFVYHINHKGDMK